MKVSEQPGYPLPAGELGEDEIVCQLVYLPDKDEYWQALLGSLSYLATWRAWERDTDKRGKDAASNWREAFELTMECWRMTCLEDITDRLDEILDFMAARKDCCDDNITYVPVDPPTSDIDPGVGDPPDEYGETTITTWDDWEEHVCYNANLYVDHLKTAADEMESAIDDNALIIGGVGAFLVLLSFTGIGLPIALSIAAAALSAMSTAATGLFNGTSEDLEAAREIIVCDILAGNDVEDTIKAVLGALSAEWLTFYQFVDYDAAVAVLHEGGYDGEYLPADTDDSCGDCDYTPLEEDDYYQDVITGDQYSYDDVTKIHSLRLNSAYGCMYTDVYYYTDDTKATRLSVRIKILSCTASVTCGGVEHHRGLIMPGGTFPWKIDHPSFPVPGDGAVNRWVSTHNVGGTVTWRVYEE